MPSTSEHHGCFVIKPYSIQQNKVCIRELSNGINSQTWTPPGSGAGLAARFKFLGSPFDPSY